MCHGLIHASIIDDMVTFLVSRNTVFILDGGSSVNTWKQSEVMDGWMDGRMDKLVDGLII